MICHVIYSNWSWICHQESWNRLNHYKTHTFSWKNFIAIVLVQSLLLSDYDNDRQGVSTDWCRFLTLYRPFSWSSWCCCCWAFYSQLWHPPPFSSFIWLFNIEVDKSLSGLNYRFRDNVSKSVPKSNVNVYLARA